MKGVATTQEVKGKIVELAKKGYDMREVSEMLGVSTRTASKYGEGLFVHSDRKSSGIKTYAIPKEVWAEWDRVTGNIRRYCRKSKV